MSSSEEDGWGPMHSLDALLGAYDAVDEEMEIQVELESLPPPNSVPQCQRGQMHRHDRTASTASDYEALVNSAPASQRIVYPAPVSDNTDDDDEDGEHKEKPRVLNNHLEHPRVYFNPPLQLQRNMFVRRMISEFHTEHGSIDKICIMGCGEMSLERSLVTTFCKFETKQVFSVDIDKQSLANGVDAMKKLLEERKTQIQSQSGMPILYRVYEGDIRETDGRFSEADCIISMEVIEHMELEDAGKFMHNVFAELKPKMFIFSTPNNDFNEAFGEAPGKFRHSDHKFEFTAIQFKDYLDCMGYRYREYYFRPITYIGQLEGFERLGGATQAAVAIRREKHEPSQSWQCTAYKLVGQLVASTYFARLRESLLKDALGRWLVEREMGEDTLVQGSFDRFWVIKVSDMINHVNASDSFKKRLHPMSVARVLRRITKNRVFIDTESDEISIIIPEKTSKNELLATFI